MHRKDGGSYMYSLSHTFQVTIPLVIQRNYCWERVLVQNPLQNDLFVSEHGPESEDWKLYSPDLSANIWWTYIFGEVNRLGEQKRRAKNTHLSGPVRFSLYAFQITQSHCYAVYFAECNCMHFRKKLLCLMNPSSGLGYITSRAP